MEEKWKESMMDAIGSCNKAWLDELLETRRSFSEQRLKLDFCRFVYHYFKFCNGPRTLQSFPFMTPLGLAASKGYSEIAKKLIFAGASENFPNMNGYTPLMLAAVAGHKHTCILLLDLGADVNVTKKRTLHNTALYYAACNGMSEIVNLLLAKGGKLCTSWNEYTPVGLELEAAIGNCHPSTTQVLLDHCEKEHLQLQRGTIFSMSLKAYSEECAIAVLRHGRYPLLKETKLFIYNSSCFHKAAECGMIKVMCLLLELDPFYLQEKWLVERDYPNELSKQPVFTAWLEEYRRHPPSLVRMCKSTVLAQLDSYYRTKIKYLPLPTSLKTFLATVESAYNLNQAGNNKNLYICASNYT